MTYSAFITPEYLYKWTVIDDNIDPNLLDTFIIKAQDVNIQQCIGNTLYVKLMNLVYTNTLSGYYQELVDYYIQKCQAEWTVYHALPYINYRLTNKAVSEKKSDTSDPTSISNVQYLREDVKNTAEFLNKRIREYIINNQAQFPEYFYPTPGQIQIMPRVDSYFGGMYLKGHKRRRGQRYYDSSNPFNECCD